MHSTVIELVKYERVKDCEHVGLTGGEWRLKYERAIREIEFTKKRLQQEFDDKLEVEQQNKRQLDRRVSGRTLHTQYTRMITHSLAQ